MGESSSMAERGFNRLLSFTEDKRVLSVGDGLGATVVQLAHQARVLWQVPFCAPLGEERNRLRLRRHMAEISHLVDTGRMVQIDAAPRHVLSNLHEDAFNLVFLHGYTTSADMAQYLDWCRHLTRTIVVHDPGNDPAREQIRVFASTQKVTLDITGPFTFLWAPAGNSYMEGGWV